MSLTKKGNIKKMNIFTIVLLSGLFTLIIGSLFMILYWLGEISGITPKIYLGELSWATAGESVIIYTVGLMVSIFLGSFIVIYLLKRFG